MSHFCLGRYVVQRPGAKNGGLPRKPRFSTRKSSSGRETDSPLEGTGFEPSVPRQEKWSMPSSSDQTRVGRTLTLGGGAESSLEGRDIELSVSPKDIRTSPYDLCANRSDRRQSREGDRWFESTSLQQRVCKLSVPRAAGCRAGVTPIARRTAPRLRAKFRIFPVS